MHPKVLYFWRKWIHNNRVIRIRKETLKATTIDHYQSWEKFSHIYSLREKFYVEKLLKAEPKEMEIQNCICEKSDKNS